MTFSPLASPRRPRLARRVGAASLALATILALTACEPEDETSTNTGASGGSAPAAPAPASSDPTSETAAPAETDAPVLGAEECVVGSWLADNAFFLASIREFGDEIKSVTGEVVITYATDGTLTTDYRAWEITAVAEGNTVTILRNGTDTGEYTATATGLSFADTAMGSALTLSGAGLNMAIDPEPAAYTDLPYTCDASALTLTTPDGTAEMTRR